MRVAVQPAPFDPGAELTAFTAGVRGAGAVVSFTGLVRDEGGSLSGMEIEHYPGMTEKAISGMVGEAVTRWSLCDALVIHRHGALLPGEAIMMVATAARHRGDAFRGGRVPDGLPEIPRAVLEEGNRRRGRGLGCGEGCR
jgi:molybdopterin synthase catalytic subunit